MKRIGVIILLSIVQVCIAQVVRAFVVDVKIDDLLEPTYMFFGLKSYEDYHHAPRVYVYVKETKTVLEEGERREIKLFPPRRDITITVEIDDFDNNWKDLTIYTKNAIIVQDWKNVEFNRLHFYNCKNVTFSEIAKQGPLFAKDASLRFWNCTEFNEDISHWDVSKVSDMSHMFHGCKKFNQPLDKWDIVSARDMSYMFADAESFNQSLDMWNVQHLEKMDSMFYRASAFNQNLGNWDLPKYVTLGLLLCGMDVEKYSKTLEEWASESRTGTCGKIDAFGLYYNKKAKAAREKLQKQREYKIDGDRLREHYILFRKPEFVAHVDTESLLRFVAEGIEDQELTQIEFEVEDQSIVEIVDPTSLKIKGLEEGTTKVTVRIPESNDHDELQATCQVTVKPSPKKPATPTEARKKGGKKNK